MPAATFVVVVIVRVDVPLVVMVDELKVPVAPVGKPETLRATAPVNPFSAPTVAVAVVLVPAVIELDVRTTASEKSGGAADPGETLDTSV